MSTIPFVDLASQRDRIAEDLAARMGRVLEHGQYVLGPEIDELESALAERTDCPHVVACASGTDGLLLALLAHGVGPGDAVIVPTFTFTANAGTLALLHATPVFVDVDPVTACIDASAIAEASATARAAGLVPRGVIAVDLYGQAADYGAVHAAAADEDLWVLADASQSVGAAYHGRPVGSLAEMTVTSFFPSKPLGAYGEGGALFTTDSHRAAQLVSLRDHGRGEHRYHTVRVGLNGRLDTLQAAVLLAKLEIFDDELGRRAVIADRYRTLMGEAVVSIGVAPQLTSTWAQFTMRVQNRDAVAARLADAGIPTAVHYPIPLHRQPAFADRSLCAGRLTGAERLAEEVLSLPMHPYLTAATQERIAAAVREAVDR